MISVAAVYDRRIRILALRHRSRINATVIDCRYKEK